MRGSWKAAVCGVLTALSALAPRVAAAQFNPGFGSNPFERDDAPAFARSFGGDPVRSFERELQADLYSLGAFSGRKSVDRYERSETERPQPWQVIAVCGRNERVRKRLVHLRFETPTLVLGFVDDLPDLLRASDVAVGKAGPGAITEALATGVPLVLTSYLPGQERSNVRFVVESGVGRYAPRASRLLAAVSDLLCGDEDARRQMRERAAALTRPGATLAAAGACLELAARYRAVSQASR